jgi:hypothetical protein
VYEGDAIPTIVAHAKHDDDMVIGIEQILRDCTPEWRFTGRRPDLSQEPLRVEITTTEHTARIDSSGMIFFSNNHGDKRYASVSRGSRLYDRIVELIRRDADDRSEPKSNHTP